MVGRAVAQALVLVLGSALLAGCQAGGPGADSSATSPVTSKPVISRPVVSKPASPVTVSGAPSAPAGGVTSAKTAVPVTVPPGTSPPATGPAKTAEPVAGIRVPPVAAGVDYQLGGIYPLPAGVSVVARDRTEKPAPGAYNICYINAFQAQPGELDWWKTNHPDLLLRNASGELVVDSNWNEALFDVSTPAKREALLRIQSTWVQGCRTAGFAAVEPDNQDSYSRSAGLFGFDANFEYLRLLAQEAHSRGLAVAQKNAGAEFGKRGRDELGLDFVVAESCSVYSECETYISAYGRAVIEIEYSDDDSAAFTTACASWAGQHSIVRRDRNLVAAGQPGYLYETC